MTLRFENDNLISKSSRPELDEGERKEKSYYIDVEILADPVTFLYLYLILIYDIYVIYIVFYNMFVYFYS